MTYVYYCPTCDVHFEVFLKGFMSEADVGEKHPCPNCGNDNTYKVFSKINVIFKGDGWGKDNKND